jgi:hypothetical protein
MVKCLNGKQKIEGLGIADSQLPLVASSNLAAATNYNVILSPDLSGRENLGTQEGVRVLCIASEAVIAIETRQSRGLRHRRVICPGSTNHDSQT